MLQFSSASIEAGDADGASLSATESRGAAAACNSVVGISWCSVETGSGAGDVSKITAERKGSGAGSSENGAAGCSSIKDGNETDSDSRAGSTGSGRGGTGRSSVKELGASLEKGDSSSGREGSSKRGTGVGPGRSDSLISPVSAIDPLTSLTIEGYADGNGSGSLNESGSSGVAVMDGAESSGSGSDVG